MRRHRVRYRVSPFLVRQRALFSPSRLPGGCVFELAIHFLDEIIEDRNSSGEEIFDQQRFYGCLKKRGFATVTKFWRRIPGQLVMGDRNERSKSVQEHNLAGLVRDRYRFRALDRRSSGRGGE